jgi:Protein of unknown function (DUF3237)
LADEGLNVRLPHCSRGIFIRQSEIARHFPGPAAASKLSVEARHLFHIALKVSPPHVIGSTPYGERRTVPVPEGEFEGERLRGVVLNGGSDWILVRPDHVWALNVRLVLQTNEGDLIEMSYRGLRHGPAHILEQVHRGEPVDPSAYYFRTSIFFETGSERYAWMNKILAIGSGYREPAGPRYQVFEVL